MPSNISKTRLHKAFDEGRRSAQEANAQNPYANVKLQRLWEEGRTKQRAGEITTPIPPLAHGETRAQRVVAKPPGSKLASRPPVRPRSAPRYRDRRGMRDR